MCHFFSVEYYNGSFVVVVVLTVEKKMAVKLIKGPEQRAMCSNTQTFVCQPP